MLLGMMPMPPDTMPRCLPKVNGRTLRFFVARPKRSWYREVVSLPFQLSVNPILEVWSANRLNCWLRLT